MSCYIMAWEAWLDSRACTCHTTKLCGSWHWRLNRVQNRVLQLICYLGYTLEETCQLQSVSAIPVTLQIIIYIINIHYLYIIYSSILKYGSKSTSISSHLQCNDWLCHMTDTVSGSDVFICFLMGRMKEKRVLECWRKTCNFIYAIKLVVTFSKLSAYNGSVLLN